MLPKPYETSMDLAKPAFYSNPKVLSEFYSGHTQGNLRAPKMRTLRQKVRQKHIPLRRNSASIRQKTCTLKQKVNKNTYPFAKSLPPSGFGMELSRPRGSPLPGQVKRGFCEITRVFSCILQHVGSDPEAERGRGEVNLSPTVGLTLRPRVGGFYMSGRLWEAQFVVFYVSGSSKRR